MASMVRSHSHAITNCIQSQKFGLSQEHQAELVNTTAKRIPELDGGATALNAQLDEIPQLVCS
jgi:hypothetical protein